MAKRAAKSHGKPKDEKPRNGAKRKPAGKKRTPPHWQTAATKDEPAPTPEAQATPHLARCGACDVSVTFTPSASGAGFTVLERSGAGVGIDTTFGIGDNGKPICPNGHGEMSLADEGMSAAEAFTQAKAKVDAATQQALFDTSKPFNFEGAWRDVASQSLAVGELARIHKEDAERAKQSKKELEEGESLLRKMITTYDARRIEKERREQAAESNPDERMCLRINALSLPCDVASMRALSTDDRMTVESWLIDAEAHPDERERWMSSIPTVLAPSDAAVAAPPEILPAADDAADEPGEAEGPNDDTADEDVIHI
jgi:hypothetical protein